MFPRPIYVPTIPCRRCRHPTRADRAVQGYGSDCAALLGLITATPRLHATTQTGPTLLDLLNGEQDDEPDDECDSWDRPADA